MRDNANLIESLYQQLYFFFFPDQMKTSKPKLTSNYFVAGKQGDQFRMATGEGQEGLQMSYLFPQRSIFLSLADAWSASSSTQVKHLNQRTNLRSTNC